MKTFFRILLRATFFFFAILSIILLFITLFREEWIKSAIFWIGEQIKLLGNWNYFISLFSAFIESFPIIGVLVPGMQIMILVGGFWGKMHLFLTIFCASIGAMIGNYIGFIIGKKYGDHIIFHYGDYIGIGKTEQKILENQISKNGFWYIVLGKFHGTLRAFIPFIAGASKMAEKNFWLYNTIGSIIWAISMNLIGVFFVDKYEIILDNFGKIMSVILALILLYIFLFKKENMKKYWQDKQAEIEEKIQAKSANTH